MNSSKKIVYLVTEDWYFWSHRLSLAEAVSGQGYEIIVITNADEYKQRIIARGFTLIPMRLSRSIANPFKELQTIISLTSLYKQIKPDIVHHIALKPIVAGSIAAWLAGMPHIINSYTGLGYLFISDSLSSRFFISVVAPLMSLIMRAKKFNSIVQNADDKKILSDLGLLNVDKTVLIRGSGVDTKLFQYSPEVSVDKPVVLFASRLLRDKGIIEFIEAVKLLKKRAVNARFVIVGDLDTASPTSIDASELDTWIKGGVVEWWGQRDDMYEVYRQVHIVCLPSYREGLPKVLLEAAACGRSIIATNVPGCREAVIDGMNGLLVPVKDSVNLAEAISRLLDSPELRYRMGKAGRRHITENFDMEIINSHTIRLYNGLTTSN